MNLQELDSYNLADAVKFNDKLNPRIWDGEKMRPEVREKLLEIAADFKESLGLTDLEVKDITVSGSNAGYTYTPYSDIDLHLVVDIPKADEDEVYRELFDAKKFQYNELHNIKIGGYDVELYVENANKPPVSQGVFSVLNDDWINIPRKRKSTVNDDAVRSKYEDYKHRIEDVVSSNDTDRINSLAKKIKTYRQAGLDAHGELGPENLAYKMLRTQGYIEKLYKARAAARDAELSLAEQNKEKKPFVYGYKNVVDEDVTATPDGVGASTRMFLSEKPVPPHEEIIKNFIRFARKEIGLKKLPKFKLHKSPDWSVEHQSFGRYTNDTDTIDLAIGDRHIMDILRTLAHELQHRVQDERETMPPDAGETGSPYENEAHAVAGVLMRKFADMHPEYFEDVPVNEASGYIPTKAQANDPRFKMALTVDIKPGQTGKEANKMALKTDKQGKPELLIKSANLLKEYQEFKQGLLEDQDLFEIKMTGKNLSKLASEIPGVKVGLEFEMIVPNVSGDDDDQEPDYDEDERVEDIDDCVRFFDDGDYNTSRELQRLRNDLEDEYHSWKFGELDEAWANQGYEYLQEFIDREDAFDRDDAMETARDEIADANPDLDQTSDEFNNLVSERVAEMEREFIQSEWEDNGEWYDRAREEFDDDHTDDYSERDWLRDQGIRYASDVQNNYDYVTWPYWRSMGDGEADIDKVALDFMNDSGLPYDSVAVGQYHGYGGYKKWVGNGWVKIGSDKPDDCFTIEPDGSLEGDNPGDRGLEFVSPPIPLDQVGTVMSKVQNWAGNYGVYTGLNNATSMHTNISIPGYSIDKLDYLKAALLLGDEHVLRQFERMGNTYAKPAIEKIKVLARDKPEKAKELLDKMKSHLDAAASKILHSGITDKYTSINTKDNRVEFRSPGGDYLSDIADDPKKMQDTINRMVVVLDAAMDPDKYKEEYQKKLYKVLTGDIGSRKGKTGELEWTVTSKANVWDKDTRKQRPAFTTTVSGTTAKDAWNTVKSMLPPDATQSEYSITPNKIPTPGNKDLLNIFSRYAAGEMPKAALKSFLKQAQLQRKVERAKLGPGKYWWNATRGGLGGRIEVVGKDEKDAKIEAAKAWRLQPVDSILRDIKVEVLRPYEDVKAPELDSRPSNPDGNWIIFNRKAPTKPVYRFMAADNGDAMNVLRRWIAVNPGTEWGFTEDPNQSLGQPGEQQPAQQGSGLYKIFNMNGGALIAGDEYGSDEEALQRAAYWARQRDTEVVVRNAQGQEVGTVSRYGTIVPTERTAPIPGSTLDLQRQRAAQQPQPQEQTGNWGIWISTSERFARQPGEYPAGQEVPLRRFASQEAADAFLAQTRENNPHMRMDVEAREIPADYQSPPPMGRQIEPARTPVGDINLFPEIEPTQQSGVNNLTPRGPGPWELASRSNNQVYFNPEHTNRAAAETEARTWIQQMGLDPAEFEVRTRETASNRRNAAQGDDWSQDFERRMQQGGTINTANEPTTGSEVGQTYSPSGSGSFTGQWLILNPNNRVIYRFGGIGNSQSDANRHAMNWLTQNPREMVDGVTVVPEMG